MSESKFNPGDLVIHKAQMHARKIGSDWHDHAVVFQVLEVLTVRCYGGTQITYTCRGASAEGIDATNRNFIEIELDPAPTEPTKKDEHPQSKRTT